MWWHANSGAMRCPHGFCPWGAPFAGRCHEEACSAVLHATWEAARSSRLDLPRREDPIRWPGEVRLAIGGAAGRALPFLNEFAPPKALAHAWHEHTGSFREAWAAATPQSIFISVADRPSCRPIAPNALHFIAEIKPFFGWYPHAIPFLTSHWDCAPLTLANDTASTIKFLQSGAVARAVEEAIFCTHAAGLFACENPPSSIEHIIGPPSARTCLADFGEHTHKSWWWWLSPSLPAVPPTHALDPATVRSTHHDVLGLDKELRAVARARTPESFAKAHVLAWAPVVSAYDAASAQPRELRGSHLQARAGALAAIPLWAASMPRVAPRLPTPPTALDRVIVVPIARGSDFYALVPDDGLIGVTIDEKSRSEPEASRLALTLGCGPGPTLVNTTLNSGGGTDYLFALAAPGDPSASHTRKCKGVAWRTYHELTLSPDTAFAAHCLHRIAQRAVTTTAAPVSVGALGPPVPLISNAEAHAWAAAEDDPAAHHAWLTFLDRERAAGEELAAAMRSVDVGNGRMREWAHNVTSAKDIANELPIPPQGLIRLHPSLRWTLLPEYFVPAPLPYTSQMLARLPPQRLPPGFIPTHVTESLEPWARRRISLHIHAACNRDVWLFRKAPHDPLGVGGDEWVNGAPPSPGWLILGPGAFKRIPHADGVGSWRACEVIQEVEPNGTLKVFDWTDKFRIRFDAESLKRVLNVESDLELLSHIFDGCCFKACPPREIRLAPNARSLASRAQPIAADLGNLAAKGHYAVRPLCWLDEAPEHDPASHLLPVFPLGYLPTWRRAQPAAPLTSQASPPRNAASLMALALTPKSGPATATRERRTVT